MIDEEATFEKFGYYPGDLEPQSNKKVMAVCDDCGKVRILRKRSYRARCRSCVSEETRKKLSDAHKGLYPSEETRKKISDAIKGERNPFFGKHHSEETRKKMSDARKGKHPSEEARKKMSDAQKGERHHLFGKHPSEETRKKMGDARKGESNPNWQGGVSFKPYCVKFNDEFKEKIRDKFGRICFLCEKTEEENGRKLSVHHVNYNKNCGCDDDKTCQFVPVCIGCNSKVNFNRDMWEKKIKAMMKNKLSGWVI